jgi:hypothetical protein
MCVPLLQSCSLAVGYCDILHLASGIGRSGRTMKSRGRHRAMEEYRRTDPRYTTFPRALGLAG